MMVDRAGIYYETRFTLAIAMSWTKVSIFCGKP